MADFVKIEIDGVPGLNAALKDITKGITNPNTRRDIAKAAVPIIVAVIQNRTPISEKPFHYRYDTPKLIGKLRAPKGMGRIAAKYARGNLRKSTIDLAERKSKYNKLPLAIIAPYYARSKGGKRVIGTSKANADGYYAHMVYGSALAYQQKVLLKGLNIASKSALTIMIRKANQIIDQLKQKNRF